MELKLTIPDYLSIEAYKKVTSLEHLSDLEKMMAVLGVLSNLSEDKMRELQIQELSKVFTEVTDSLIDVNPEFYPLFEIEGQLYGYNPITKMTLGEFVDVTNLTKDPIKNLEQIMALLYRPVLKHRFNGIKWAFKNSFKTGLGEVEDLTKYYTLEAYSTELRNKNAEIMNKLPVSFALGALSFFLQVGNSLLLGTQTYSAVGRKLTNKETKELAKRMTLAISTNIGDGLQQFITSRQLPSLVSQEIKLSQI